MTTYSHVPIITRDEPPIGWDGYSTQKGQLYLDSATGTLYKSLSKGWAVDWEQLKLLDESELASAVADGISNNPDLVIRDEFGRADVNDPIDPMGIANKQYVDEVSSRAVIRNRLTDIANSWWSQPATYYDSVRQRIYITGCTRGAATLTGTATMMVGYFDLVTGEIVKHSIRTGVPDDHNTPTALLTTDLPPIFFTTNHDNDSVVKMHKGPAVHDFSSFVTTDVAFPGSCSYQVAWRKPGTQTICLLTRQADGWWMRRSTDWGVTWSAAFRFMGKSYMAFRRDGDVLQFATTVHPTTGVNVDVRYFRADINTGAITNAAGTAIDNLYTMSTVIAAANMTLVKQYFDPESTRVLDISPDGSIVICDINKPTPEVGGTYKVFAYQTTDNWTRQTITPSGVPIGYLSSAYVGGAVFGATGNEIFLCKESSGTWTLERWTRVGSTWSLDRTVHTAPAGKKLGRPRIPYLGELTDHLLVLEYGQYSEDNYWDYYADQILLSRSL